MRQIFVTFAFISVIGCTGELEQENGRLRLEVEQLNRSVVDLERAHKDAAPQIAKAQQLATFRTAAQATIMASLDQAAAMTLPKAGLESEDCAKNRLFRDYALAKLRWLRLGPHNAGRRLLAGRSLPLLELLVGDDPTPLAGLDIEKVASKRVLKTLLAYHDKIVAKKKWKTRLLTIRRDHEEADAVYPHLTDLSAEDFYEAGFPESTNTCLVDEGISYSHNQGDPPIELYDSVSPELWFYSFWFRRYHEGSFELTFRLLSQVVKAAP
jgi:hypothetical protein